MTGRIEEFASLAILSYGCTCALETTIDLVFKGTFHSIRTSISLVFSGFFFPVNGKPIVPFSAYMVRSSRWIKSYLIKF